MEFPLALLTIAASVYFVIRGVDVRLVLFTAGLVLTSLALQPWLALDAFRDEMGNGATIGPICSAMGYAYLLKATGCDRDMVRLLLRPVHRAPGWLVPVGCLAGFVTNIAITSQTAAAAAVGPILLPLMLGAGFPPAIAGATLILGCSGGGSLLNPSDADLVAIQRFSRLPVSDVWRAMVAPLLVGALTAFAVFSIRSCRNRSTADLPSGPVEGEPAQPPSLLKALLPPLPVLLIFATLPTFNLFPALLVRYPAGLPVPHAMLVCTALLLLLYGRDLSSQTRTFFDGMGFAYVQVISLIMTAAVFIAGLRSVGFIEHFVGFVQGGTTLSLLASALLPGTLAVLCGSGIAPTVAYAQAVLPDVAAANPTLALDLGACAAIASSFGRSMSPVAAVVIFTAGLTRLPPTTLARQTAPALLAGLLATLAYLVLLR